MLCYWSSLVTSDVIKLSQRIYDVQMSGLRSGWLSSVRNHLLELDMFELWVNQELGCSREVFKSNVKKGLFKLQSKEAFDSFSLSNKAILFKQLIADNDPSKPSWYISALTDPVIIRNIAAIRMHNHRLSVEVGSWNQIEFSARYCTFCQCLEDEYHFVLQCPRYNVLRKKFIDNALIARPSMLHLIQLLNSESIYVLNRLGIFLKRSFKMPREIDNVLGYPSQDEQDQ